MARESSEASGSDSSREMRRSSVAKACAKARSISCEVPRMAAGSGTPQCAVMGWPGQMGHTSLAALSQTVKTKLNRGAPGAANSSQDLLRSPSTGRPTACNCRNASGRTVPDGWLPAL